MEENSIFIKKENLLMALKTLETIIVSMDRIGSSISTMSQEDVDTLTLNFLKDWNVFRKLSDVRKLLSEPFSDEIAEDDMDELEREFKNLQYWSIKQPKK